MSTVWKKVLEILPEQQIELPAGAQMLCAKEQHGKPCIWFRCDPDAPTVKRLIRLVGAGHEAPPFDSMWKYLGTAFLEHGTQVLHIFEQQP